MLITAYRRVKEERHGNLVPSQKRVCAFNAYITEVIIPGFKILLSAFISKAIMTAELRLKGIHQARDVPSLFTVYPCSGLATAFIFLGVRDFRFGGLRVT